MYISFSRWKIKIKWHVKNEKNKNVEKQMKDWKCCGRPLESVESVRMSKAIVTCGPQNWTFNTRVWKPNLYSRVPILQYRTNGPYRVIDLFHVISLCHVSAHFTLFLELALNTLGPSKSYYYTTIASSIYSLILLTLYILP